MTTVAFKNAEQKYANLEQSLNTWGYVPFASIGSGLVRFVLGGLQSFLASWASIFKGAEYFITRNPETRNEAAAYFWYGVHGEMNMQRGAVEAVPFIGNAATAIYDNVIGLRINYTHEKLPGGVDPIFESKAKSV